MAGDDDSSTDCSLSDVQEAVETAEKQPNLRTKERPFPRVNCPEHIIIVMDVCKEEDSTPFKLTEGSKFSTLIMIKRALTLFLYNKHAMSAEHKYALVVLHPTPIWVHDFTSNPQDLINNFDDIEESEGSNQCDLTLLFDQLADQVTLPQSNTPSVLPPPYIIRTILIYGRSQCLPLFLTGKTSYNKLLESPHFFLDILYLHENPSDDNKCEGIYDLLCGLDESEWSYILEVAKNATKLHNLTGYLLAHPLQRPAQKDTRYTLSTTE